MAPPNERCSPGQRQRIAYKPSHKYRTAAVREAPATGTESSCVFAILRLEKFSSLRPDADAPQPVTAAVVKKAVSDFKHQTYPKLTPKRTEPIPTEILQAVRKADKLLFKVKRCMKTGDLAQTMVFLHHIRQSLHFHPASGRNNHL
jgi:hypothetical protein